MHSFELFVVASLALSCAGAPHRPTTVGALSLRGEAGVASLASVLQAHEATVLVFWSAGCPCVRRYQGRLEALKARYGEHVGFVAISSNADETLESVTSAAKARGVTFPVWRDEGGEVAQALGARSTPTVVLLRNDGSVLYSGWVDNERPEGEPGREPWLEHALEGVSHGTRFAARSPTWGCAVTRSLVAPKECHADAAHPREGAEP